MRGGERLQIGIHQRPLDHPAVDGIRPVEHQDRDPLLRGLLHDVDERRQVGVVAGADVLDVEDQERDVLEHRRGRPAGCPVKAPDRKAGHHVATVRHVGVGHAREPVLGREDRLQTDARGAGDQVDRAAAAQIDSGLVGHEADGVSRQHRELLVGEHVEPREDPFLRQDGLARRHSKLGRRPVGGGTADGSRIRDDRWLEELGAGGRGDANPEIADT